MLRPIFVIDTNVLIDYPNIIMVQGNNQPEDASVDLQNAHIVIPTAVIRELSRFKGESSNRGVAARMILRYLRDLFEGKPPQTMQDVYELQAALEINGGNQVLSILPVRKNFTKNIPFRPSSTDMDAQIILTTLTVIEKMKVSSEIKILSKNEDDFVTKAIKQPGGSSEITLLTNDNGLAIRANARGIKTARYSYKLRPPYTGRRKVCVPRDLILRFATGSNSEVIEKSEWDAQIPNETDLAANEFIVMYPDEYTEDERCDIIRSFKNVGRYDKKTGRIVHLEFFNCLASIRPKNIGQAIYIEALMNPDISAVICSGPAGSGKTFLAAIYAYQACKMGRYFGINVVPCSSESDDVGYLPGDLNEKLNPAVAPIKNAIHNYLLQSDEKFKDAISRSKKYGSAPQGKEDHKSLKERVNEQVELIWKNWFGEPIPIAYARGRDFAYEIALYDEFQDQNRTQADTLLKRLGKDGKIIITGDIDQIHSPYLDEENNGLTYARNLLRDNPYVAQVTFTEDEVIRHPLVQEIVTRQARSK